MNAREGRRTLYRRLRAHPVNVRFADAVALALVAGFVEVRRRGSHRIFRHRTYGEVFLNLQECRGEAKPYQVRQLVRLIQEYDLLEE